MIKTTPLRVLEQTERLSHRDSAHTLTRIIEDGTNCSYFESMIITHKAQETCHSPPEAVRRNVNDFNRVREWLKAGWTVEKTAYAAGLPKDLAQEYIDMMGEYFPFFFKEMN